MYMNSFPLALKVNEITNLEILVAKPGRFATIPCEILAAVHIRIQELSTSTEPSGALRKILDASVSDAERQSKPEISLQGKSQSESGISGSLD